LPGNPVNVGEDEPAPWRADQAGGARDDLQPFNPQQRDGTGAVAAVVGSLEVDGRERPGRVQRQHGGSLCGLPPVYEKSGLRLFENLTSPASPVVAWPIEQSGVPRYWHRAASFPAPEQPRALRRLTGRGSAPGRHARWGPGRSAPPATARQ